MQIEIVAHCWRYWRCLTYHLSAIFLLPPSECSVKLTVFFSSEDDGTVNRIGEFSGLSWPDSVIFNPKVLPSELLFRRSIGRNIAALETSADLVWFTDCDFVINGNAVDQLGCLSQQVLGPLMYPGMIRQSPKPLGATLIAAATDWQGPLTLPTDGFEKHSIRRAIGAVQIVKGEVCRQRGYLNGHKRAQRPASRWRRCFEDVRFRKSLGEKGQRLSISDIYRLRHIECGRRNSEIDL